MNHPQPIVFEAAPRSEALAVVGHSRAHESATLHVTGTAVYTDDMPELAGTLHAALVLAEVAHGSVRSIDVDALRAQPGVVDVMVGADVPGHNECSPVHAHDEPIFADKVQFYGQPLVAVAATSHDIARRAARRAKVEYDKQPALLSVYDALAADSHLLPTIEVARGNAQTAIAVAPHRLTGEVYLGGQEHFYLEGQVSYAVPGENDSMHVYCSTQHPTEMQHLVADALGWQAHQVQITCRRMGGGFGGKESQSQHTACVAALLAWKTGKPVKMRLDRDDDMSITGKRHDFDIRYEVGFADDGMILGIKFELASRCGYSADLSGPVNDRAIFHCDNAYYLDAVAIRSLRMKTHTVSNTAFRGFGGPQGIFAIEAVIEDIARHLGADPLAVRRCNLYGDSAGDARTMTPYGMKVEDNVLAPLIDQLAADSDYAARRDRIAAFNAANPIVKRGISLTPIKFGISFTATLFNQAGALVHVYNDGTVLVSQGGTEMGQGLYTKIRQIVAEVFGLSFDAVRMSATDTTRVPNTSATAASSGTDLNGMAARAAALEIRERLAQFAAGLHGADAASVTFSDGRVHVAGTEQPFAALVMEAYRARIKLWEAGFYKTPKIHYDATTMQGRPFFYFAYGAAVSEVAIDTLTGQTRVLRVDVLHDVGRSLNPAIDIGQIEGGFVQGMGWLTTEELWWREDGKLMTHAPLTYKIPAASDCPEVFNVKLFDNANVEDSIHKSKAVGEPPLMLPFSVFFAIRAAVAAAIPAGAPLRLDAPATPEAILRAIAAGRGTPMEDAR
ncbi:MAG: xanthine dehydrogenase molybdopterin binding subunit [Rhodocyclaceae bacterium]